MTALFSLIFLWALLYSRPIARVALLSIPLWLLYLVLFYLSLQLLIYLVGQLAMA